MKAFFRSFLASLLAIVVVLVVIVAAIGIKVSKKPSIKDHSYLVVDVYGEILPYFPPDGVIAEILGGEPETLHRILSNLEKAAADKRIEGVILKVSSNNSLGLASLEEVRGAVAKVRDAGKKVYAFSDSMDRNSLYLVSACDSIIMPVTGYVNFAGFGGALMYVKGALDKLGIKPNLHQIEDYKSAAELVTRTDMSPEAREMRNWILDDIWELQIGAISEDRGISENRILELMEHVLFTVDEAKEAGLVDEILYWDELDARLRREDDKKLRTVSQKTYAGVERSKVGLKGKKKIAIVHAHGMIGGRESHVDPLMGVIMGHETVSAELRRVRRDKDVAAVVFRVESNGGEGLASDLISHEVAVLAGEKPVVASMIDVAASGGYMIAYRADKIVADPTTITGSIGSISAKFNTVGFYNKLGITFDHITKGPNGLFWSSQHDFTEEQRRRFEENHWDGFNWWLRDVSEYREIPFDDLKDLAMGRVWTGRQAKQNRLIDEVGGLDRAIELAKELAEIPEDEEVTIVHYPKKKGLLAALTGGGTGTSAIRRILYQFIRQDLAQSLELLANSESVIDQ
ncbi:MAG: signal peptide peptidase SppA [Candidatus Latescibacterota bacterium]|nr:MAG: signal peptide peptidase SppA [Candidatus Latescibacterota bacterium]